MHLLLLMSTLNRLNNVFRFPRVKIFSCSTFVTCDSPGLIELFWSVLAIISMFSMATSSVSVWLTTFENRRLSVAGSLVARSCKSLSSESPSIGRGDVSFSKYFVTSSREITTRHVLIFV